MTSILTWLNGLRLSITQWAFVSLAAVVGGLVLALRLQGSRLHETQIKLLIATVNQSDTLKEQAVVLAKTKLQAALKDYYASKK